MSRRTLVFLVVLAVLVAAVIALIAFRPSPEIEVQLDWSVDASCPDAALIGAAGSGQRDDVLGVGPQVESAVSAFAEYLEKESSVSVFAGFTALDYPAPGIIEGTLQALAGDGDMFDSIAQGQTAMTTLIAQINEQCADTRIYMIGYSQGASVVHTTVVDLPDEYRSSIAGVVALADPYRDADDPNAQHFTNEPDPDRPGTPAPHTRDGSLSGLPLPDWVQGSFYSACAQRDTVCNFALRDLLVTDDAHTEPTYHGLGPELGRLLAEDLLDRL